MKKNKAMRTAAGLGIATLLTMSVISGSFAKYTTSANGEDSARVAKWGFEGGSTITLDKLFEKAYTDTTNGETVKSSADVIAPGTSGSATFGFTYGGATGETAPEVAYTFVVDTKGSKCAEDIKKNTNIQWKLDDNGTWGTWDAMITAIEALDGNVTANDTEGIKADNYYKPGTLPKNFEKTGANTHTVYWQWVFNTNDSADESDTTMGNKVTLDDVALKITVTATQVD